MMSPRANASAISDFNMPPDIFSVALMKQRSILIHSKLNPLQLKKIHNSQTKRKIILANAIPSRKCLDMRKACTVSNTATTQL